MGETLEHDTPTAPHSPDLESALHADSPQRVADRLLLPFDELNRFHPGWRCVPRPLLSFLVQMDLFGSDETLYRALVDHVRPSEADSLQKACDLAAMLSEDFGSADVRRNVCGDDHRPPTTTAAPSPYSTFSFLRLQGSLAMATTYITEARRAAYWDPC